MSQLDATILSLGILAVLVLVTVAVYWRTHPKRWVSPLLTDWRDGK